LPRQPVIAEGFAATNHDLAWFASTAIRNPISFLDTGSLSITGNWSLNASGSYGFNLSIAGSGAGTTFTVTANGSSDYTWTVAGGYADNGGSNTAGYTVVTAELTQRVSLSYLFQEFDASSNLLWEESGSSTFTVSDGSVPFDGFRWYAFNWRSISQHLSDLRGFDLEHCTWDFTTTQSGTIHFAFEKGGSRNFSGTGTQDSASGGSFGSLTYSYDSNSGYSLEVSGSGSFSHSQSGNLPTVVTSSPVLSTMKPVATLRSIASPAPGRSPAPAKVATTTVLTTSVVTPIKVWIL